MELQIYEIIISFIIVLINAVITLKSENKVSRVIYLIAVIIWSVFLGLTIYKIKVI